MFKKWTSIEKFSDALILAQRQYVKSIFYRRKTKLHGTNASVRVEKDGTVFYQKRSSDITPEYDNFGFANWASKIDFNKINKLYGEGEYNIFGEWAGQGVASGDAVCFINKRTFFIFSIEVTLNNTEEDVFIVCDPEIINRIVKDVIEERDDIKIIPWEDDPIKVSVFGNQENSITPNEYADYINKEIEKIEVRDGYIFKEFGVDKSGEGYVCYPSLNGFFQVIPRDVFGSYVFKAKTAAHSANKTKGAKVKLEVPSSVIDFADTYVNDSRCEQMIREHCNGEYSMKNTALFLRALISDIEKETVNEREAGNIDMKMANKYISTKAVNWLKHKTENL